MSELYLTSGDVAEIARIPPNTLDRWVRAGIVPAKGSGGRGNHRTFTLTEAVAVACGVAVRGLGFGHDGVAEAVRFVASQSPAELEAAFAEGRRVVIPRPAALGGARLMEVYPDVDATREQVLNFHSMNLEAMYRRAKRKARQMIRGPVNRLGRNRGLAKAPAREKG
jgi:DNA-binding transcriptional MerR regulator